MNAKKYLLQIKRIDLQISNKVAEKERWQTLAGYTGISTSERVQTSGDLHQMEKAVCNYVDLEREIDEEIKRLADKKREIIKMIERLESNIEYDILHRKYVQGKDLQDIADDMKKGYSSITTAHGRALKHLQKLLDEVDDGKESWTEQRKS